MMKRCNINLINLLKIFIIFNNMSTILYLDSYFIVAVDNQNLDFYEILKYTLFEYNFQPFLEKGLLDYSIHEKDGNIIYKIHNKKNIPNVSFLIDEKTYIYIPYDDSFNFQTYFNLFIVYYTLYSSSFMYIGGEKFPYDLDEFYRYISDLYAHICDIIPYFTESDFIYKGTLFNLKNDNREIRETFNFNVVNSIG